MAGAYDAILDAEQGAAPVTRQNPYDAFLDTEVQQNQQRARSVFEKALAVNPDQAAESKKLANTTGLPPDLVARNLDEIKRKEQARMLDLVRLAQDSPVLTHQLMNPSFANQTHDHVANLSALEHTFNVARALPAGLAGSVGSLVSGIGEGINIGARATGLTAVSRAVKDLTGMDPGVALDVGGSLKFVGGGWKQLADAIGPAPENKNFATDVSAGIGQLIQQVGLQIATGGTASLVSLFSQGIDIATEKTKKDDASQAVKDFTALTFGSITALTEKYGVDALLNRVPPAIKNTALRWVADKFAAAGIEATQEVTEGVLQDVVRKMLTNSDAKIGEGVGYEASVAGTSAAIVRAALGVRVRSGIEQQRGVEAEQHAEQLKAQFQLASQALLRERNPDEFRTLVQAMADNTDGAPKEVYVDAEVLNQLAPEVLAQLPEAVRAALPDALAANDVVAIPVGDVLTIAPGTPLEAMLIENARLGGVTSMSQAEAKQAGTKAQEFLAQESQRVIQQATDQQAMQESSDRVRQGVLDQLNTAGRFRKDVNEAYATWTAAFYTTMAGRLGVTPEQMAQQYPLRVTGQTGQGDTLKTGRVGELSVEGFHFSPTDRTYVSTSMYGKGLQGSNRELFKNAKDQRLAKRSYFYADTGTGINPEDGVGGRGHKAQLTNVYDSNTDPLRLKGGSQEDFESAVLDAGFSGYLDRMSGDQSGQVIMLGDQDIQVQKLGGIAKTTGQRVPPVGTREAKGRDAVVDALNADAALPLGSPTLARWQQLLAKSPEVLQALTDAGVFAGDQTANVYRSELVRRFIRATPAESYAQKPQSDVGHKREGSGRYVGAPDWVGSSSAQLGHLRKQLRKLAVEGEAGRYWYENSGRAVLEMTGGDKVEAEKFVALLAIFSQGTEVSANVTFALTAYYQWKAGLPINTGRFPTAQSKKAEDILRNNKGWEGVKTNNFYNDLMEEIDPTKTDEVHATMDMWMALAFDYGDTHLDQGPKYAFAKRETIRLAEELGWKPHQVQAAIWVSIKTRVESTTKLRKEIETKKGIEPGSYEHFRLATKLGMEAAVTQEQIAEGGDFGTLMQNRLVQLSWEATPSTSTGRSLPGIHAAPTEQKLEYLAAMQKALAAEDGSNALATLAGLPQGVTVTGFSAWGGEIGAGAQTLLAVPSEGLGKDRTIRPVAKGLLDTYSAALGYILEQDAVIYHTPVWDDAKVRHNGAHIATVNPLTEAEVRQLYTALHDHFGTWDLAPGYRPDGVRVLNFVEGLENSAFHEGLDTVLKSLPEGFGGGDIGVKSFRSDGGYISNNWTENPNGEGYLQRIQEGRPDILERVAGLRASAQAVNAEFAAKYGWDKPSSDTQTYAQDGEIDGRSEQTGDGSGRPTGRGLAPLEGAPSVPGFQGPDPRIVAVAEQYARANGITLKRQAEYVRVDPERAARIAAAYEAMPHAPQDPVVKEAYSNMLGQAGAQYRALIDAGYKFWFIDLSQPSNAEYASTPWNAMRDMRANQQMGVFPTNDGFGSNEDFNPEANPLLADTGFEWPVGGPDGPMQKVLANDLFRAVHDAFGHGLEGAGFRAQGEENAWQAHSRLFTGSAVGAITSETRGQNSYLNFGPNGEKNRAAKVEDTVFADQKTGLMPEWTWTEGRAGDQADVLNQAPTTDAFEVWFGDSKVVDAEGKPLVVYHGTKAAPTEFERSRKGAASTFLGSYEVERHGIFAAESPNLAEEYANQGERPTNQTVMPLFMAIENPLDTVDGQYTDAIWNGIERAAESLGAESPYRTARYIGDLWSRGELWKLFDEDEGNDPAWNVELLKKAGYDGMRIYERSEGDVGNTAAWVAFDPTQVKSATGNSGKFDGTDPNILKQGPRGTFNPKTLELALNENADLSTFLHETGHFFLEVMADLASQPNAPAGITADTDALLKWFGVADLQTWNVMTLDQKRPYHERFAESFEQYLMEGKAPSLELQPLFRKFRAWMLNVYKSLKAFVDGRTGETQIQLSDEIRKVFDRMLASEEQIAQANEVAGLLPNEDADAAALEKLTARSLRDLKWTVNFRSKEIKKLQAQAKALRKGVEAEVTAEVNAMPEFQAKDMLDKTRRENKEQLNDTELAIIADAFQYPSVQEMLRAIDAAGKKADVIEGMTDQRMLERHGDLIDQRAIEAAANEAVHNEARARSLATELRSQAEMLNPRTDTGKVNAKGSKITVNAIVEAAKQFAANVVSKTPLRDLKAKAWQHTAAERRAGKRWQEATAAGKTEEAVKAKQDQVLNNAAAKAALDAQDEMRKVLEFFKRVVKDGNEKTVEKGRDPDVVNAARAVLGAYGIAPRGAKTATEYMELVAKNDPAMHAALQPSMQAALNIAKPLDTVTLDELRDLHEEIQAMWHLAKRSRQMEVDGNLMDMQDAEDELQTRMQAIGVPLTMPGDSGAVTKAQERVRKLQGVRALLRRVEQWSEGMGKPFTRLVFRPVKDAADAYRADRVVYRKKYQALVDAVAPALTKGLIAAPELGYTFGEGHNGIGHAELLHAILHTGNASNKRKLLLGRGWATENEDGTLDTSKWDAFLQRAHDTGILNKAHYDFAQGVWDLLEQAKPLAQKTHRDVFGRYFAEVTADSFETPFGSYRGGYVPAQADPRIVQDADLRKLAELENENMSFSFPGTNKGFTKGRVEYNRPLMLDLRTIGQHLDKVLLFTHMEPAVRDVNKLLSRKGVSYSLGRIDPAAYGGMLTPWLNRSARQIVETPVVGDGDISRVLSAARSRAGMALMFANVSNTLQQLTGFSLAATKVKPSSMLAATAQFIASPRKTAQAVSEASAFMANRMENEISAINDAMDDILLDPSAYEKAQNWTRKHAYFMQTAMANTMEPIIWTGAYNDALERGDSERDAVRFADSVIRTTQGSTLPEDVSRIETGPAYARIFTQFIGYFNMMANTNATALKQIAQEIGLKKGAGKALGVVTLGLLVPIWVAEAIAQAMRGGPDDEDDDGYLDDWLAAVFGMGTIKGAFATVPFVGQLANAAINRFNGNPADDKMSLSPAVSLLESAAGLPIDVYKAITDPEKLNKRNAVRDVASAVSIATGLPATALARPLGYWAGVADDRIEPTSTADAVRGAITGSASPASK